MGILDLIDASIACVKCGTRGVGNCDCYVKVVCVRCKKYRMMERGEWSFEFRVIEITCPECEVAT